MLFRLTRVLVRLTRVLVRLTRVLVRLTRVLVRLTRVLVRIIRVLFRLTGVLIRLTRVFFSITWYNMSSAVLHGWSNAMKWFPFWSNRQSITEQKVKSLKLTSYMYNICVCPAIDYNYQPIKIRGQFVILYDIYLTICQVLSDFADLRPYQKKCLFSGNCSTFPNFWSLLPGLNNSRMQTDARNIEMYPHWLYTL